MWTARAAYEDAQLWKDIQAGKKFLTWRIGHETFVVGQIVETEDGLTAYLNDGACRPIKGYAHLETHWNHHPDYKKIAEQILSMVSGEIPQPVELMEKPEGVYRWEIIAPEGHTRGAECDAGLFERYPMEHTAKRVIAALEKDF